MKTKIIIGGLSVLLIGVFFITRTPSRVNQIPSDLRDAVAGDNMPAIGQAKADGQNCNTAGAQQNVLASLQKDASVSNVRISSKRYYDNTAQSPMDRDQTIIFAAYDQNVAGTLSHTVCFYRYAANQCRKIESFCGPEPK